MKPLKFEEYYERNIEVFGSSKGLIGLIWRNARIGMIPEDKAIKIPKGEDWPDEAQSIVISYSTYSEEWKNKEDNWGLIKHIPRPTEPYKPRVGDKVFYNLREFGIGCGVIQAEEDNR